MFNQPMIEEKYLLGDRAWKGSRWNDGQDARILGYTLSLLPGKVPIPCCYSLLIQLQNLSLEQLRYVNLPRRKSLVGATPELDNPSNDLISEVNQDALVLFIPGDGETQGTEWVFTGFLASQSFRDERKSMLEGGEQKSKTKKGGRNRRRR